MQKHGQQPPDETESSRHGENDEPEPEKGVYLLVDYVQGHYAEGVVFLDVTRRTVLVEGALGDLKITIDY